MALTGNKGEWSEIYALFKLLGDTKLYPGDADLKRVEELCYPIIRVLRAETSGKAEYEVNGDLVFVHSSGSTLKIPIKTFKEQALSLLAAIRKGGGRAFPVTSTEAFMKTVKCTTIKAKSSVKTDIQIVVHDLRTGMTPNLGFSIKSRLGGRSTLLNASSHTNFLYKSKKPIDDPQRRAFETKKLFKDKFRALNGVTFQFVGTESETFGENLTLVDSRLEEIIGYLVYYYYSEGINSIQGLCERLTKSNPLGYKSKHNHKFYEYKLKKFLTEVALGMMPSKTWSGTYDATGGYLVVKEDGDILCYHIYNRNDFENYLFKNTVLDTPSTSRYGLGKIIKQGPDFFTKLNLQIRFI